MATYLGSFVQLCCGTGGTLQTNIAGVCGACSQCMDYIGFSPAHSSVCFPGLHYSGSRVLCRALSKVGPVLVHFPGLKLLRFRFLSTPQGHRLSLACVLHPSQVRAAQVIRCLAGTVAATYHLPHPCHSVFWV